MSRHYIVRVPWLVGHRHGSVIDHSRFTEAGLNRLVQKGWLLEVDSSDDAASPRADAGVSIDQPGSAVVEDVGLVDLDVVSASELRDLAREHGIPGRSKMSTVELRERLGELM